jgi:hypothetical protein
MSVEILIGLVTLNVALGVTQVVMIVKFSRLLNNAANGAADHFEKLRSQRQVGV